MTTPAPLFTNTVNVAGEEPTTSDVAVDATVTVAPAMTMGICVEMPLAVAVMVAVRVAKLVVPDENVTTALPVVSLVTDEAESTPVSAENATGTPDTTAFEELVTVAVIVVVVLLSDATDVDDALSEIAAALGGGVTGVVGVDDDDEEPPPPHAARSEKTARAVKSETARDQIEFKMCSCDDGWQSCNVRRPGITRRFNKAR